HIPYDCVVFGHPEIWDDSRVLRNLSRYKVLVLPTIDAISDAQVEALKDFMQKGGKIVVCDPRAGTRDENFNPRQKRALEGISVIGMIDKTDQPDAALNAMRAVSLVSVEAPKKVTVNIWKSADGQSLDIHLLNYDVDLEKNQANPVSSVQVTVKVPSNFYFEKAIWNRPGIRKLDIPFEQEGDVVTFTLPSLQDYSVISLSTEEALDEANSYLKERRTLDREAVKKLATKYNLY
ncbi:MAG: beta-galactosidase trimerization domain-containing protein, partial [Armatimonadetes bacterium]|nr:beta-galactosidase trimerization domain-containing protein [Armatimonadota bacterium]